MDIAASMAKLSIDRNHVRPQFLPQSENTETPFLEIIGGRHPMIESVNDGMSFVANDCILGRDFLLSLHDYWSQYGGEIDVFTADSVADLDGTEWIVRPL